MNLVTETKGRLQYAKVNLIDLKECFNIGNLTKDCRHHLQDEIKKTKRNIEYYEGILNKLEEKK